VLVAVAIGSGSSVTTGGVGVGVISGVDVAAGAVEVTGVEELMPSAVFGVFAQAESERTTATHAIQRTIWLIFTRLLYRKNH
jgi:hypothetical protein